MTQILLVSEEPAMRALLREILEELGGYPVAEARDVTSALYVLRSSQESMVALFGSMVSTSLLQAAIDEPALRRHAFVLLTAYPEGVTPSSRALLTALDVPVVAKPFTLDTLLDAVAAAAERTRQHSGYSLSA
jgi:CheY-like chemotaxis protein